MFFPGLLLDVVERTVIDFINSFAAHPPLMPLPMTIASKVFLLSPIISNIIMPGAFDKYL